ncbi:SET domain-containing protein-lysine N-methyltransferase [Streptomyces cadmiisoli]|uniref:SET domain-containing protein-lysine N-methyltransferase n=1 Tax=Streptomyces cadmiisoli TaxID=2184053 RepID=UPI0013A6ED9F|nr:SET domain-containing protein-lysine N-methyltransferase [Streptomyces cadmiisoli]
MQERDSYVDAGAVRGGLGDEVHANGVRIVMDRDKGRCVVSARRFAPGETVVAGDVERAVPIRTNHSFQVGWDTHVDLTTPARDINHSCEPNTGIRDNDRGGFDFVALREIFPSEEITWDYETSEYVSIAVSRCLCGENRCRSAIRGFKYRQEDETWQPTHLAGYLREEYDAVSTAREASGAGRHPVAREV